MGDEKILVTGGAGFIGSHLTEKLVAMGHRVVVLDNFDPFYDEKVKHKNMEGYMASGMVDFVQGDIRDMDTCKKVFAEHKITRVAHLAGKAGVRPSLEDPIVYEEVNCRGTLNLLECAKDPRVAMFVFGSSSSVYGCCPRVPFSEDDHDLVPISPYAASKLSGEAYCKTFHHLYGIPMVMLRFFTVYGPRQRPDLAISKFTRLAFNGEEIPMFGDGSTRRDYTFVSDIVQGIVAALFSSLQCEVINLGNSNPTTLTELIDRVRTATGKELKIKPLPVQAGDVPQTYANVSKAERLLGYKPSTTTKEGVPRYVEWYRSVYGVK
ncbi:unnamed protein product [Pedinophyceae sp. YPF-701]|nr:unnamed protein product [Pedinophyceae sp. YPF-701]